MNTATQTQKRQQAIGQNRKTIAEYTGMDELAYNNLQFDLGCEFAEIRILDQRMSRDVMALPEYWSWWRNEYYLFEEDILSPEIFIHGNLDENRRRYQWAMQHIINDYVVYKGLEHFLKSF